MTSRAAGRRLGGDRVGGVVGDHGRRGADEGQEPDGGEHQLGEPPASLRVRMGMRSSMRASVRVPGMRVAVPSGVLVAGCHR